MEKGEKRKRWTGADLEEIIAAQVTFSSTQIDLNLMS